MSKPRLSIVMPSLNQAQYLEEAICSILDQGYPELEFMILDGGSRDGSREIIERYAPHLAYWRSGPDRGQSDAIAWGFGRATGDLWGWINSDDALLPGALAQIARAYRDHPGGGIFGGNYLLMDADSRIIRCKRHPANAAWFARHGIFAFNPAGSFFRGRDYEQVGGLRLDLHYVMDTDLFIRLAAHGASYVHVPRYLSLFRKHGGQKTTALNDRTMAEHRQLLRELLPESIGLWTKERRWRLIFRCWQLINGNYLRMSLDTLKYRGRHWRDLKL
jgi:glycosyltransferase involved in cell wall biosynthesis